ncbi:MAG: hypothetical protein ACI4SI_08930 [Candidatus Ornithospirochaeta sp.]
MTTLRNLYEWAVMNKVEDLPVGLQYQDAGGTYNGDTFADMGPDHEISIEKVSLSTGTDKARYLLLS